MQLHSTTQDHNNQQKQDPMTTIKLPITAIKTNQNIYYKNIKPDFEYAIENSDRIEFV